FGQARKGMVDDVAFSPDGKTLAMASREGSVLLWDVVGGKLLERLKGHSSAVGAVTFSPDGRTLATGGGDQTVRLWNVQTRRELACRALALGRGRQGVRSPPETQSRRASILAANARPDPRGHGALSRGAPGPCGDAVVGRRETPHPGRAAADCGDRRSGFHA